MLKLKVFGMTCGHCVSAVTRAVQGVPSVEAVEVDLQSGKVAVRGDADRAAIRAAVVEEGYQVEEDA